MINRLEIRMNDDLLNAIDDWCENYGAGCSRSEAIRTILDENVREEHKLTFAERISLSLQLKEMIENARNKPKQEQNEYEIKELELALCCVEEGHDWALKDVFPFVSNPDKKSDVDFVFDVLTMFRNIKNAYNMLSNREKSEIIDLPKFDGFDGNHESNLLSIARFILEKLERFYGDFDYLTDLNSHANRVDYYSNLLEKYNLIWKKYNGLPFQGLLQLTKKD